MLYLSFLIIAIASLMTFRSPGWGLPIAANSYLIKSAFAVGEDATVINESDQILGILLPVIIFLIIGFKTRKKILNFRFNLLDISFIFLGILLLLSSFSTSNYWVGVQISGRYFLQGISFYFFAKILLLENNSSKVGEYISRTILSIWLLSVVVSLLSLLSALAGNSWGERATIGRANPIPLSLLISMGVLCALYYLMNGRNTLFPRISRTLALTSLPILFIALAISQTRSMVFALFASICLMVYFSIRGTKNILKLISLSAIIVSFLSFIYYFTYRWKPEIIDSWLLRLLNIANSSSDRSIGERFFTYRSAFDMFSQNPLFGVGTGKFGDVSGFSNYAHNLFLEIAAEQGLLGLMLLLNIFCLVFLQFRYLNRKVPYNSEAVLFAALFLLNLVVSQFSFTLWHHKNMFLSIALFASTISIGRSRISLSRQLSALVLNEKATQNL